MTSGTDTPNGDMVAAMLPDEEILQADGFDEAIIGYAEVWREKSQRRVMAYDRDKCIDILMERDGMDWSGANEYFDFNVAGAYVGPATPVFISETSECDHVYETLDDGTKVCFECDHIKGDEE